MRAHPLRYFDQQPVFAGVQRDIYFGHIRFVAAVDVSVQYFRAVQPDASTVVVTDLELAVLRGF